MDSRHDRRRPLLSILLLFGLVAASCQPTGENAGRGERDNTIRYYLSEYPASLSLIGKTDKNAEIVAVQISDSLVQYDAALELRPRLAESWEVSEDGRSLTFHLREGVRWHDGEPFTAADVAFTIERLIEPSTENRTWAPMFADLQSIEPLDDLTVRATFAEATPDRLEGFRVPVLPRHVAGLDEDLLTGEFSRHPIGCGPFRFVSRVPDREIVLEANDDYWDGRPNADRLIFRVFADQRTAYQGLLAGDLDIMHLSSNLYAEALASPRADRLEAMVLRQLSAWLLLWNQDGSNPFFVDPRVRQAMVLALDRQEFIDHVLHGDARVGATTYHPETVWGDPAIEPRPYAPEEARRLLDEAGWRDTDGDGIRDRDGRPFSFSLLIPASSQKLTDHLAAWKKQAWTDIGLDVRIEKLEWLAFRKRRNNGQFEAAAHTLHFTPNPDQLELYHSSGRESGINYMGLADAEVDRLVEAGRRTFDFDERREIYRALQRRLYELEPLTCVFYFATPYLHDARLGGITPSPIGISTIVEGPRLWSWSDTAEAE